MGTNRILGVEEHLHSDNENPEVPWIPENLSERLEPGAAVLGDFEVCPLTKERPGEMQMVCVESASKLVVKYALKPHGRIAH